MKTTPIPVGLLLRVSVTADQGERERDAILRGVAELLESVPIDHYAARVLIEPERFRAGKRARRESSRRVYLMLLARRSDATPAHQ